MVHRRERLPKAMEPPLMAYCLVRAALTFAVVAFATVQSAAICETLERAEEVPIRLAPWAREDQARVRIPFPPGTE